MDRIKTLAARIAGMSQAADRADPRAFDMYLPGSFDEASALLVEHDATPIAGGTALMTLMKEGVFQPDALVNLRSLSSEHDYIEERDGVVEVGGLTPLRDIETSPLVEERLPVVASCLGEVASIRVRNVATIGGNLAHADPNLDLPPVLAGLDAELVLHGPDGERVVPLREFVRGYYDTDLGPGELVKALRVPVTDRRGVYLKHRSLSAVDWPCVGVAAFLDPGGSVPEVFMNSVADSPIFRVDGLDDVFADGATTAAIERAGELAADQCDPIDDVRGSAWYKRRMADVFTRRAITCVLEGGP